MVHRGKFVTEGGGFRWVAALAGKWHKPTERGRELDNPLGISLAMHSLVIV